MDTIDYNTCQSTDVVKHVAIAQHEAFHDAPRKGCRNLKRCLSVFHKIRIDRGWHIFWGQELRIVRIDQGSEWRDAIDISQQRVIVRCAAITRPAALAFLQEPQPHHVLEKTRGAEDASLVGAIGSEGFWGQDRLLELHSDQRPGAGADISPAAR